MQLWRPGRAKINTWSNFKNCGPDTPNCNRTLKVSQVSGEEGYGPQKGHLLFHSHKWGISQQVSTKKNSQIPKPFVKETEHQPPRISLCSYYTEWTAIINATLRQTMITTSERESQNLLHLPVQSLSHVCLFATPGLQHARLPCPSLSPSLLKLTSFESVMLYNHLILCSRPSFAFNLSQHQGLFQWIGS